MRPLLVPFATATATAALVVASLFTVRADRTQDELTGNGTGYVRSPTFSPHPTHGPRPAGTPGDAVSE
jgi:hypothetical protein